MKFLVDAQLPPELALWVAGQGHSADHVEDLGMLAADDNAVWRVALETGAIIITKDRDFVVWARARDPAPPIVWLRTGNARNSELIARCERAWERVVRHLESGVQVVEVGRS